MAQVPVGDVIGSLVETFMSWIRPLRRITALVGVTMLVPLVGTAWAEPRNDSFSGARVITSVPFSTTEDTTQATFGPADTAAVQACHGDGLTFSNTVWFAYTPSRSDQQLQLDTSGSSYQTGEAVLTGKPAAFSPVSCGLGTSMTFEVFQGTTYYIDFAAGGFGGTLRLSLTPPGTPLPAAPSVSITSPANGATYVQGRVVNASFKCTEGARGPGIASCVGTVPNGSPIATTTPGRHTFTVTATSKDGQRVSRTVRYTILPSNQFTVSQIRTSADGTIRFLIRVPGPGSVDVLATSPKNNLARAAVRLKPAPDSFVFARKHVRAADRGTVAVTVKPDRRGKLLVAHHRHPVLLALWVSYTPHGGRYRTIGFLGLHLPGTCANHNTVTARKWRTVVRCN
jgi:hypothetical protein